MVTAEYILFTKYVSFISSNGAFPDLIIFISIFSYLTRVINSVGSEDEKEALAYSTVAQTSNLFSSTIILSSSFMLLGFITHGVYKAGSFMAEGTSSLNDNVGQKDEGNESNWILDPIRSFIRSLIGFMTLALPRTLTHTFKWSLAAIHSEIRFVAIFDMSLLYILVTMFSSITTGLLIIRASQQFSNSNNTPINIRNRKKIKKQNNLISSLTNTIKKDLYSVNTYNYKEKGVIIRTVAENKLRANYSSKKAQFLLKNFNKFTIMFNLIYQVLKFEQKLGFILKPVVISTEINATFYYKKLRFIFYDYAFEYKLKDSYEYEKISSLITKKYSNIEIKSIVISKLYHLLDKEYSNVYKYKYYGNRKNRFINNIGLEIDDSKNICYEYNKYTNKISINIYSFVFLLIRLNIIYEIEINISIQYINTQIINFI